MENKKKVEAVLFSLGKEVSLEKLAGLCSLEKEEVRKIMEELKGEYGQRDHSFSISQRGEIYKLTVKDEFLPIVNKLAEGTDLDRALMETLAVIAWKYPVTQSEVIKLRHNKAYEHIKRLMELDFVEKEKTGRTFKLKLTKKFFEYFDLPSEEAKKAFLTKIPAGVLREAENVEKEADEVEKLVEEEKKEKKAKTEIHQAVESIQKEERKREIAKRKKTKEEKEEEGEEREEAEGEEESLEEEEIGAAEEESGEEEPGGREKIGRGMSWVFG